MEATSRDRLAKLLVSVFVAALLASCYLAFVRMDVADDASLRGLLVSSVATPGIGDTPTFSSTFSSSALRAYSAAEKSDPSETGGYAVEWQAKGSEVNSVDLTLEYLPDSATAANLEAEEITAETSPAALRSLDEQPTGHLKVPGVGGAGVTFSVIRPKSSTNSSEGTVTTYGDALVYRVGRAVVREIVETTDPSHARPLGVAADEVRLLNARLPGFRLSHTHFPLVGTVVMAGLAVVLIAAVWAIPGARRRAAERSRRRLEEERRLKAQSRSGAAPSRRRARR